MHTTSRELLKGNKIKVTRKNVLDAVVRSVKVYIL